jgi:uncharacterized protein (DUF608 family)
MHIRGSSVWSALIMLAAYHVDTMAETATMFPVDLPRAEWVHFRAEGFSEPACGVVYASGDKVTNGLSLGGVGTGCIDLETTGLLGYSTIFNSHIPRLGPINLPILGISLDGETWVLCKNLVKTPEYIGVGPKGPTDPVPGELDLNGVKTVQDVRYWGHYPVADMEFITDAPVGVGLRAWSPFLPGDIVDSMVPGIIFETHLRNHSDTKQEGTIAFSFPGPTQKEAGCQTFQHNELKGKNAGVSVTGEMASYAITILDCDKVRTGGSLGADGQAWSAIEKILPNVDASSAAASVAVDFSLASGEETIVRFVLTWSAPRWAGDGVPQGGKNATITEAWICPDGAWNDKALRIADMNHETHHRGNPATFDGTFEVVPDQRIALYIGPKVGHASDYVGAQMKVEVLSVADPSATIKAGDTWDLKRDWSDQSNPNGQWEFGDCNGGRLGPAFRSQDDWQPNSIAGSTAKTQPAWANNPNGEGWARIANDKPFGGDTLIGDIVAKPWASARWISPANCQIRVTAGTWMIREGSFSDNTYTHMYAAHYPDAVFTADYLARNHKSLLARTLAWQQVIYTENNLPIWLRDSLINILYCLTEDGLWAQKTPNMPAWVSAEDGLFGLNESPRACPQMECIPCSFYGSLPLVYFFPELQLSTIRAYKNYQAPDGCPPWIIGAAVNLTKPNWNPYQASTNGISLAGIVDRFLLCRDTPDRQYTREFYPMIKKAMEYTIFTSKDSNPQYSEGEQVIAMPLKYGNKEWFEADFPGWLGCVAHVGLLHLAQARITERMARQVGDEAFANQCASWVEEGAKAMEDRLWDDRGYYWNFHDPVEGKKSEFVFGYQMDGEWVTDLHGLPSALPEHRVKTTLKTIKRTNIALSRSAAVNYAHADGTPIRQAKDGTWDYGRYSYFPPEALMLAMNYMYEGQVPYGIELARRMWHNVVCLQGYTWDVPNIMRGDADTGERVFGNDYYQDMIMWSLPAAIEQEDVSAPCKPGGLVDRILKAAR